MNAAAIEREVIQQVRELVRELGSGRAAVLVAPGASLDRDLGLGSLERVELVVRLEAAFGVGLPEQAIVQARTVADLAAEVTRARIDGRVAPTAGGARAPATEEFVAARAPAEAVSAEPEDPLRFLETSPTLVELLARRAAATPDTVHIWLREDEGEERPISYGDLYRSAASLAAGLAEQGIPAGAPVALIFPTGREFFQAFFGVLMAGGVPLPLYPPHRLDQIEEYAGRQAAILSHAEVRLLLTSTRTELLGSILRTRVRSLERVGSVAELARHAPATLGARVRPEDLALLQYTSGSTGMPKGVMLTHANLMSNLRAIAHGTGLTPQDVCVTWLPLYHDMGLIGTWLGAMAAGIPTHVMSPTAFLTRPQRWLWAIHQHRGTITAAPNFAYGLCAAKLPDRALEGLDLRCWRVALNGAEPISPAGMRRFIERMGKYGFRPEAMFPAYGLAENSVALTFPPLGRRPRIDRVDRSAFVGSGRAVATASETVPAMEFVGVGSAALGSEVRVVDAGGRAVAERVVGRIQFRGESATPGYYRHEDETARLIGPGGWHETGDLGYWADGELFVSGRVKDLVIKAGRNLAPQEIEELAGAVPGVRTGSVAAFAAPLINGDEGLVIVAESRVEGADARSEVVRGIAERIVSVLGVAPDDVVLVAAGTVPKTSSGKIRRSACREAWMRGELHGPRTGHAWVFLARAVVERAIERVARIAWKCGAFAYGLWALAAVFLPYLPIWALCRGARPGPRTSALVRSWARLGLALAGLTPKVRGAEHLRGPGARVIVANHTSYLDSIVLAAVLPGEPRGVAKSELLDDPAFGPLVRATGAYIVRRDDMQKGLGDEAKIEAGLTAGDCVVWFPEGTFTPATGLRPFKLGAFKAAAAAGVPVVPVALRGVRDVLRDRTAIPRWGRIEVHVGPPIHAGSSQWREVVRLRDRAREWIGAECGEPILDLVRAGVPVEE